MDEKCLKAPVYTTETVFKDSAEVPIDIEFNLPDYCPEISRILKCRAVPRVSSKTVNNRSVSVSGSVTVTVIYADSDNMINSYEYQYPFSKSFETGEDTDGADVFVKLKCEYINCRAVTERKIDIHGAVGVYVLLTCRKSREILTDIDDDGIEVRRENAPATTPISLGEKYVILDEELEIGSSQPDIRCLIRYDAAASIAECKLLAGKAVVKGSVAVNLLYKGEGGEMQSYNSVIPFSQFIEIEGVDEDCECEASADVAYLEIKPGFSSGENTRAFLLDGKMLITVKAFCENEIEVISDAYSKKFEAQIISEDICINKTLCSINDTFVTKENLELPGNGVSGICDVWCDVKSEKTTVEGDCLIVSGTVNANIIAVDSDGAPAFYERPIDYLYSYKLPSGTGDLRADPDVTVNEINYTISGENSAEIRLTMAVTATVYDCRKLPLVSNVELDKSKPLTAPNRAALTVYFAESGESLWQISKHYLADVGEVRRINDIEGDKLAKRQMILVPAN